MKKIFIGLLIVMVVLAIIGAITIKHSDETLERTQWVERTEEWNLSK